MSALRIFTLEEDLRPDDNSLTLTCSNSPCSAPIRKGHRYGIRPNTNLIYCAACSADPSAIVAAPEPVAAPKPAPAPRLRGVRPAAPTRPQGGQPLPEGRWSREFDACEMCGATNRPHRGRGLCNRCIKSGPRPDMGAQGRACATCGRTDRPHRGGGMCASCYQRARRARLAAPPVNVDWRGVPFPSLDGGG